MNQAEPPELIHFKLRTVTLGVSLLDRIAQDWKELTDGVVDKLEPILKAFDSALNQARNETDITIMSKRITITPIEILVRAAVEESLRHDLDRNEIKDQIVKLCQDIEVCAYDNLTLVRDLPLFIGGYTALLEKGAGPTNEVFLLALPYVLQQTEYFNASINVATSERGIDLEAVRSMGTAIGDMALVDSRTIRAMDLEKQTGQTKEKLQKIRDKLKNSSFIAVNSICARLAVFANAPYDNPFMAGGYHGPPEPELAIHVGMSGAGDLQDAVESLRARGSTEVMEYHSEIRDVVSKMVALAHGFRGYIITLMNDQLIKIPRTRALQPKHGIVDLSVAPTDARVPGSGEPDDSIASVIEAIGASCGCPGSLAALALIIDAIKKGGVSEADYLGGLSGTFIPLSEDAGMADAVARGDLRYEKYEAMTSVCSVGVDMIPVYIPVDLSPQKRAELISGLILDEMAIGVINGKTTSVRILPLLRKRKPNRNTWFVFMGGGGLLGAAPALTVPCSPSQIPSDLVSLSGRIAQPVSRLTN